MNFIQRIFGFGKDKENEKKPKLQVYDIEKKEEDTISFEEEGTEPLIDTVYLDYHFNNDSEMIKRIAEYKDEIDFASKKWGVSPNLIAAIMSLESSGGSNGKAKNIMEVQFDSHKDEIKSAYSFTDKKVIKIVLTNDVNNSKYKDCDIKITEGDLKNSHTAISIGTFLLAKCARDRNFNIPIALQEYNMGHGNMTTILNNARDSLGYETRSQLIDDKTSLVFTNYTNAVNAGDPNYVKDVMQYINIYNNGNDDHEIYIKNVNNSNDIVESKIKILPESMK